MAINTGISGKDRQEIAKGLANLLADTYTLYLKTQNFHWNVKGEMFYTLHLLFEQQYRELANAADTLAERIRALDYPAPGSFAQFSKLTDIKEATTVPAAKKMIEQLRADNETVARKARELFSVADDVGDDATADLLSERMGAHEKAAWMLRSLLG